VATERAEAAGVRAEITRGLAEPVAGDEVVWWEMAKEQGVEGGGALAILGGDLPDQES